MKLLCTKEEYKDLIDSCVKGTMYDACTGCIFNCFCDEERDTDFIVDICEIVEDKDG